MDGKPFIGTQPAEKQPGAPAVVKTIKTETTNTVLGEDGIIRVIMHPGSSEDLASAKAAIDALGKLCGGKKCPVIVDMAGTIGATQDARRYYSSEQATKQMSACAMLVGSPLSKVLCSFFLGLNKPRHPVQLFTSEPDAVAWLKGYQT
ncbi:hypothetical protein TG4357_03234 [Thalassovita gelatinovora]|uniref:DUF7793 domain-containing protein n=1 Tax=Thalassovita gelatinovora TaxID=53501 RepID=A0A0P1FJB0_THAGE|nr:STAS/SEC14 domain-containing protein [Thalassovita gelatinovora]QIZ82194.1 STAS/SEC14 domain-containing protein [Thalassovita gelatinovora]CUH67823.1 hypothetical protein TG4357_03234 [Thalassovita gelatinovora]SEP66608.1 hypothetical protein SAMN04488043_10126 [Thalassovita gelatinovora]